MHFKQLGPVVLVAIVTSSWDKCNEPLSSLISQGLGLGAELFQFSSNTDRRDTGRLKNTKAKKKKKKKNETKTNKTKQNKNKQTNTRKP